MEQKTTTMMGRTVAVDKHPQRNGVANAGSGHKQGQGATISYYRTALEAASKHTAPQASSASKSSSCYTPFKTTNSGFKSKQRLQSSQGHNFDSSSIDSPVKQITPYSNGPTQVAQQTLTPRIIEVDTLFIGGGPATLGVLANAYQTQRLDDLILGSSANKPAGKGNGNVNDHKTNISNSKGNHSFSMSLNQIMSDSKVHNGSFKVSSNLNGTFNGVLPSNNGNQTDDQGAGIAILDVSDQFGGGNLQRHYGIKSNTSASGFLKVLMYSKQNTVNPTQQKSSSQPSAGSSNFTGDRKIATNGGTIVQILSGQTGQQNIGQFQAITHQQSKFSNSSNSAANGIQRLAGGSSSGGCNLLNMQQKSQNRLRNNQNSSLSTTPQKIVNKPISKSISNAHQIMSNTVGPSVFKGLINGGHQQPVIHHQTSSSQQQSSTTAASAIRVNKAEADKQTDIKKQFMPPFVDFASNNDIALSLQKYGKKVAPLQLIGTFMSYAGNAMLNDIWHRYQKKVFYGNSQAVKITQVSETYSVDSQTANSTWMTEVRFNRGPANQRTFFKSKNIILACGAEQILPHPQILKQQYGLKDSCHIFNSDQVLKQDGFQQLVKKINSYQGKCRIHILGGSHSAFSVLYLLLSGPCKIKVFDDYKRNCKIKAQVSKSVQKKTAGNLESPNNTSNKLSPAKNQSKSGKMKDILNESGKKSQTLVGRQDSAHHSIHVGPKGYQMNFCHNCFYCHLGLAHSKMKICQCGVQCQCLSNPHIPPSPRSKSSPSGKQSLIIDKKNSASSPKPHLTGDDHVSIVYRKQIKVHFSTVEQATQEMYSSFDKKLDLSQGGIVYPFTGIRGDAKDIWMRVNKGLEPHASFIRADTTDEQRQVLSQADIVVFACGYQSRQIPVFDSRGQQIKLSSNLYFNQSNEQAAQLRQPSTSQNNNGTQTSAPGSAQPAMSPSLVVQKIQKPNIQTQVTKIVPSNIREAIQREYVDVNHNCQLMDARNNNKPIPGLYGIGQGYSLSTSDNAVQAELRPGGKADSVGLYIKQIGNKILAQLLPKKKIFYLMPPKEGATAGLQMQGHMPGSLLDQLNKNKDHQAGQVVNSTTYGQYPHHNQLLSNHNGHHIMAQSLVTGSANQLSLNTMSNFNDKSRTTSGKLYYHPKTQEHRSDKFQNFQYNGKIFGHHGPPLQQSLNNQTHFGSVFTKSAGQSSHNVHAVAPKNMASNMHTGLQANTQPLASGNSINSIANRVNTANKSTSSQGFTSISEYLGARKMNYPSHSQQVNISNPQYPTAETQNTTASRLNNFPHHKVNQVQLNSTHLGLHNPSRSEERQGLSLHQKNMSKQADLFNASSPPQPHSGPKSNGSTGGKRSSHGKRKSDKPQAQQSTHNGRPDGSIFQKKNPDLESKLAKVQDQSLVPKSQDQNHPRYASSEQDRQIQVTNQDRTMIIIQGQHASSPMMNSNIIQNSAKVMESANVSYQFSDSYYQQQMGQLQSSVDMSSSHPQYNQHLAQAVTQAPSSTYNQNNSVETTKADLMMAATTNIMNRARNDTVPLNSIGQNMFTDGGMLHHLARQPNSGESSWNYQNPQYQLKSYGQSQVIGDAQQMTNNSFASNKKTTNPSNLNYVDMSSSLYRQNVGATGGSTQTCANSSLEKSHPPIASVTQSFVQGNDQSVSSFLSKTTSFNNRGDAVLQQSQQPIVGTVILQANPHSNNSQQQKSNMQAEMLSHHHAIEHQSSLVHGQHLIDNHRTDRHSPTHPISSPQLIAPDGGTFSHDSPKTYHLQAQAHLSASNYHQIPPGTMERDVERHGPPLSEKNLYEKHEYGDSVTGRGKERSKFENMSRYDNRVGKHRNTMSINGALNGPEVKSSGLLTSQHRDISRGKDSFTSPYIHHNIGNKSMYDGHIAGNGAISYVTSNRQKEFQPRGYASGTQGLGPNGGEGEFLNPHYHRITKSNNFQNSYFQSSYQEHIAGGMPTSGGPLASSNQIPVGPMQGPAHILSKQSYSLPNNSKSSGPQKQRVNTGATGAAGNIMAANIANMGYQYPTGPPSSELVPINSGCASDLKKLKMGTVSSGQTVKESGRAVIAAKDSKATVDSLTAAFMAPMSDNHRQSPPTYAQKRQQIHQQQAVDAHISQNTSMQGQRRVGIISGGTSASQNPNNQLHQQASRSSINAQPAFNTDFDVKQTSSASAKTQNAMAQSTFQQTSMALKKNQSHAHVKKSSKQQRGMSGFISGSAVNRLVTDMLKQNNYLGKATTVPQKPHVTNGGSNLNHAINANKIIGNPQQIK